MKKILFLPACFLIFLSQANAQIKEQTTQHVKQQTEQVAKQIIESQTKSAVNGIKATDLMNGKVSEIPVSWDYNFISDDNTQYKVHYDGKINSSGTLNGTAIITTKMSGYSEKTSTMSWMCHVQFYCDCGHNPQHTASSSSEAGKVSQKYGCTVWNTRCT